MECKKIQQTSDYNKKEAGSYREQTSSYQREGGRGNIRGGRVGGTSFWVNKLFKI